MSKKPKGTVGIEVNQGRLRIRLPRQVYGGVQKYFYPGLSNTKENRRIAQAKAQQIEADIIFERFDPTLEKYKPPVYEPPPPARQQTDPVNLLTLWNAYTVYKAKALSPSSLKDFRKVKNHLAKLPTQSLTQGKAIASHLRENLSPDAARRVLMQVSACCQWAVDGGLIEENPFAGKLAKVKVQKNLNIHPFTAGERDLSKRLIKTHATAITQRLLSSCSPPGAVPARPLDSAGTTLIQTFSISPSKRRL